MTDAKLSFDKKDEWIGTDIVFEITKKGDKTEVHFTHAGLVPAFQCYGDCSTAWSTLVRGNLRRLITTGQGSTGRFHAKARQGKTTAASFSVDQSPKEVFDAINNVRGWWSEEIEGSTDKQGAEFDYHYKDVHRCRMRITELVPEMKVGMARPGQLFQFHRGQDRVEGHEDQLRDRQEGRQDGSPLHARGPCARIRVLRRLLKRVGLLRQREPEEADHHGQREPKPQGRRGESVQVMLSLAPPHAGQPAIVAACARSINRVGRHIITTQRISRHRRTCPSGPPLRKWDRHQRQTASRDSSAL